MSFNVWPSVFALNLMVDRCVIFGAKSWHPSSVQRRVLNLYRESFDVTTRPGANTMKHIFYVKTPLYYVKFQKSKKTLKII